MDGRRKKWELENRELVTELPSHPETDFSIPGPERPSLRAFRDDVLGSVGTATFVDVRSPAEFSGETWRRRICRRSSPTSEVTSRGRRTSPGPARPTRTAPSRIDELRAIYGGKGVDGSRDGSWTEYGSLVNAPVERDV